MQNEIQYFFLVHKKTKNEFEAAKIGKEMYDWQEAIKGMPKKTKIKMIKDN
tara:strand:+ start:113 stop:265 length:153 start_codon:yes stop_codon:yes gene_type:complete